MERWVKVISRVLLFTIVLLNIANIDVNASIGEENILAIQVADSVSANINAGEIIDIEVFFEKNTSGADTIFFTIEYDKQYLEIVDEPIGMNGWSVDGFDSGNGMVSLSYKSGEQYIEENQPVAQISFTAKDSIGNTNIQLTDINVAGMGTDYILEENSDVIAVSIGEVNIENFSFADHFELKSSASSLKVGDEVTVDFVFKDFQLSAFSGYFIYDKDVFEEVTQTNWKFSEEYLYDSCVYSKVDKLVVYFEDDTDVNGVVCSVTLKVKKAVLTTNLSYKVVEAYNYTNDMMYNYSGCEISITDTPSTHNFSLTSTPVSGSSDVNIPINIAENTGFNALGVTITYDDNLFTYKELTVSDAFSDKIALQSVYPVPDEGKIKAALIASNNITDLGNFLNLALSVKEGVPAGTSSEVSVTIEQVTNLEETPMVSKGATTIVTVKEPYLLGDVNEDEKIDLTDAVYILRAYNGEKTLSDVQSKAANVNGDGSIDLADALQILKYFNGEISTF